MEKQKNLKVENRKGKAENPKKTEPKKKNPKVGVKITLKKTKIKKVKAESVPKPTYDTIGIEKKLNLNQFRGRIVTMAEDLVVPDYIKLVKLDKLQSSKACFDELKRRGFSAELSKLGVEIVKNNEQKK